MLPTLSAKSRSWSGRQALPEAPKSSAACCICCCWRGVLANTALLPLPPPLLWLASRTDSGCRPSATAGAPRDGGRDGDGRQHCRHPAPALL